MKDKAGTRGGQPTSTSCPFSSFSKYITPLPFHLHLIANPGRRLFNNCYWLAIFDYNIVSVHISAFSGLFLYYQDCLPLLVFYIVRLFMPTYGVILLLGRNRF